MAGKISPPAADRKRKTRTAHEPRLARNTRYVRLRVPVAEQPQEGYGSDEAPRVALSVNGQTDGRAQTDAFWALKTGLLLEGATLNNGEPVATNIQAFRWLCERIADADKAGSSS